MKQTLLSKTISSGRFNFNCLFQFHRKSIIAYIQFTVIIYEHLVFY